MKMGKALAIAAFSMLACDVAHATQAGFKCRILDTYNPNQPIDTNFQNIPYDFHISIEIPEGQTSGRFYRVGHVTHRGRTGPDGTMTGVVNQMATTGGVKFYRVSWWTTGGPANLSITLDGAHSTFSVDGLMQKGICTVDSFHSIPAPTPAKR